MKEPLAHVARAKLPWRASPNLTECGLAMESVAEAISRDDFIARVKRDGERRAAYSTCMTCWEACKHNPGNQDAATIDSVARYVDRVRWNRRAMREEFLADMHAISVLVERYADEFEELVQDYRQVVRVEFSQAKETKTQ